MATTRRQYLAARRKERGGRPLPKFKLGDFVEDIDGERRGMISFVGSYDDYLESWTYKVLEPDGTRKYRNEVSLVLVKRPRARTKFKIGNRLGFRGSNHTATIIDIGPGTLKIVDDATGHEEWISDKSSYVRKLRK